MLLSARSAKTLFLELFLVLLGAVALGGSHLKESSSDELYAMYTLSAIVLGITTVIASTRVLGSYQDTCVPSPPLPPPSHPSLAIVLWCNLLVILDTNPAVL
jgi:hypothetical protein